MQKWEFLFLQKIHNSKGSNEKRIHWMEIWSASENTRSTKIKHWLFFKIYQNSLDYSKKTRNASREFFSLKFRKLSKYILKTKKKRNRSVKDVTINVWFFTIFILKVSSYSIMPDCLLFDYDNCFSVVEMRQNKTSKFSNFAPRNKPILLICVQGYLHASCLFLRHTNVLYYFVRS